MIGRQHIAWHPMVPIVAVLILLTSCSEDPVTPPSTPPAGGGGGTGDGEYGGGYDSYYGTGEIAFIDDLSTNTDVAQDLLNLTFVDIEGHETKPADYANGKHVVLVMTRGNTSPICPYCSTQTSRLIANYAEFESRNAEVIVGYPVQSNRDVERLEWFLEASKNRLEDPNQPVPFPILIDIELKAVDQLGIRKDLSKPATYILDTDGQVRFAYVGASLEDRPSIKAMLAELDKLNGEPSAATTAESTPESADAGPPADE